MKGIWVKVRIEQLMTSVLILVMTLKMQKKGNKMPQMKHK